MVTRMLVRVRVRVVPPSISAASCSASGFLAVPGIVHVRDVKSGRVESPGGTRLGEDGGGVLLLLLVRRNRGAAVSCRRAGLRRGDGFVGKVRILERWWHLLVRKMNWTLSFAVRGGKRRSLRIHPAGRGRGSFHPWEAARRWLLLVAGSRSALLWQLDGRKLFLIRTHAKSPRTGHSTASTVANLMIPDHVAFAAGRAALVQRHRGMLRRRMMIVPRTGHAWSSSHRRQHNLASAAFHASNTKNVWHKNGGGMRKLLAMRLEHATLPLLLLLK